MRHYECNSSAIRAFAYDSRERVLRVDFQHGGTYLYVGVPERVRRGLRRTTSVGRYYHKKVKGQFPSMRLDR